MHSSMMLLFILSTLICTLATNAAPAASSIQFHSNKIHTESSKANYENYWVPLRAAMKRNLKTLEKNTEILREKFAEFTKNSTSFETAYIDLQIVEVLETIDKLQKQFDRTPVRVILPSDPAPDIPSTTTEKPAPSTGTTAPTPTTTAVAPSKPPGPPVPIFPTPVAPVTRPPSPQRPIYPPIFQPAPQHPWSYPSGMPAIAGFLSIDDGNNEMNSANGRFLGMNWLNNPAFAEFLGAFLR